MLSTQNSSRQISTQKIAYKNRHHLTLIKNKKKQRVTADPRHKEKLSHPLVILRLSSNPRTLFRSLYIHPFGRARRSNFKRFSTSES